MINLNNKELLGIGLFLSILSTSCNSDQKNTATTSVPGESVKSSELSIQVKSKACNPEIEKRVKKIVAEQLGVKEEISLSANFVDDLGADSLDTVEIVMALEEEFECEVPDEEAEKIKTVEQAVDYFCTNLK